MTGTERIRVDGTLAIKLLHPDGRINGGRGDLPGRAWYLLGWFSRNITFTDGSVDLDVARALFTNDDSPYRICGRRQWNKIKQRGMGVLWNESGGRLYLVGKAAVCVALGIEYVEGYEVEIPVLSLVGKMAQVRAIFMAADIAGRKEPAPIARKTRQQKNGLCKVTQRRYERRAAVKVEKNTAVVGDFSEHGLAQLRYHYGKAAYHRKADNKLCFSLPNTYRSPDDMVRVEGKQSRRLNRAIKRSKPLAAGTVAPTKHPRLYFSKAKTPVRRPKYQVNESYHLLEPGVWRAKMPNLVV